MQAGLAVVDHRLCFALRDHRLCFRAVRSSTLPSRRALIDFAFALRAQGSA